jgi:hypothetical protein
MNENYAQIKPSVGQGFLFLKTKQIANTTLTVALTSKGQFQINSLE